MTGWWRTSRRSDLIRRNPSVDGLVSTIGGTCAASTLGPNLGPDRGASQARGERSKSANAIIEELRPQVERIPGLLVISRIRQPSESADRSARVSINTRAGRPTGRHLHNGACAARGVEASTVSSMSRQTSRTTARRST